MDKIRPDRLRVSEHSRLQRGVSYSNATHKRQSTGRVRRQKGSGGATSCARERI
ncbi:hypothetical protein BDV09DRAFT_171608 [Aspergillus tetrazonus]